jgi:hypothetical protein
MSEPMMTAGASRFRKDGITSVRKLLCGVADRSTPHFREPPPASYWDTKPTGVSGFTRAFGCSS